MVLRGLANWILRTTPEPKRERERAIQADFSIVPDPRANNVWHDLTEVSVITLAECCPAEKAPRESDRHAAPAPA
jgi:hypothetical protein